MYYKIIFTINNSIHNIKVTGDNIILLNNSEIDLINLKKKDDKVNIFTSIDEITNFNINIEDVSELAEDIDDLLTQLLILNGGSKKKVNGNIQKGGKGKFKAIKKYLDEIVKSIQNLENKQDLEKINKSLEKLHHLLTPVENPKLNEVIDSLKELIKKIENKYNEIQLLYTFLELLFKIINDEKQNNDKYDLEILFRFLKDNTFNMILPTTNNNLDLSKFLKLTKPPNLSAYKRFNKLKLIETYYKIEFENKKALNELISIEFGNRIQDELNELLMTFNQDINLTNFLSYTSKTSKNIKLLAESIIELNLIIDTEEIIQKRIVLELICSFTQLVNLTIKSSGSFILQELPPNIGRLLKLKNLKINCLDGSNFIDKSFNSAEILKSVRLPKSLIELSEIKEVEIKILSDFTKDINGDENKLLIELKENLSTASQSNEIIEGLKTQILDYFKDNPLDNLLYDGNYSFLGLDLSKLNTFSDKQKKNFVLNICEDVLHSEELFFKRFIFLYRPLQQQYTVDISDMKIFIFNIDDTLKYFELKLYNEYKSSSQTGAFEILKIIIQLILNYKSMCEHEKNSFIESNNYELNEILETEIITLPTGISKKETEELIEKDKKHLDDLFNLFLYIT